jgi:hypothetical protein
MRLCFTWLQVVEELLLSASEKFCSASWEHVDVAWVKFEHAGNAREVLARTSKHNKKGKTAAMFAEDTFFCRRENHFL